MALPQGINFRATAGFVTDGANEYGEITTVNSYPTTTSQGNNVGWETTTGGVSTRDRNNAVGARFAGIHFTGDTNVYRYRIDLPSTGSYLFRCAAGDNGSSGNEAKLELFDGTTSKGVLASGTLSATDKYKDAVNVEYDHTTWPASNTGVTNTFATTILRVDIGSAGSGLAYLVAHIYVESAGSSAPLQPFSSNLFFINDVTEQF